ncbi:YciI family protein [Mycolicibacterium sp. CBMA 226]|uniref:YciI family protein n=1 Tax=Mycolicibacterium sp. CBMA 226 TaxID=2606611 RepID=UPI0013057D82|nr:YciI family protein [Mycolicibacterium sp. CBMA 226]MUL79217.1 GTP cyclohydrolase [Mycolicibacterium sp. CBMA 226]
MFHVLNITYTQPLDVVDQARPAHLEWLGNLVNERRILLAGRLESQAGAVLIASDMTAEEADALTAGDPYVHAGVATYERVSFNAGFRADGL